MHAQLENYEASVGEQSLPAAPLYRPKLTPTQQSLHRAQKLRAAKFRIVPIVNTEQPVVVPIQVKPYGDDVFGPVVLPGEIFEPTIRDIMRAACRHFKVSETDMKSIRRQADMAYPRHVAMYLCHTLTGKSYPMIARAFGDRNHTSVMHAVRHIQGLLSARNETVESDHDAIAAVLA